MTSLARLTNTAVNIIGSTGTVVTSYGGTSIGVTGNNFDISSLSNGATGGTVTIGSIGGGNVGLGNASAGVTTLSSLVTNIGTSGATTVNIGSTGTTGSSMVNIGLGATGINIGTGSTGTVTIGNANGVVRLNGPLTLGSAPSSGSTASAPYLGSYYTSSTITSSPTGNGQIIGNISIATPGIYYVTCYSQLYLTTANVTASACMSIPLIGSIGFSTPYGSGGLYQSALGTFHLVNSGNYSADIGLGGNYIVGNIRTSGITFSYFYIRIA